MGDTDTWAGFSYSGYYGHGDYGSDDDAYNGNHEPIYSSKLTKTCKYCGKSGLSWKKTDLGWRLFTKTHNAHECQYHERSKINA